MTDRDRGDEPELTSEIAFGRLEQLRELLKLTDYLRGFRPLDGAGDESAPALDAAPDRPR